MGQQLWIIRGSESPMRASLSNYSIYKGKGCQPDLQKNKKTKNLSVVGNVKEQELLGIAGGMETSENFCPSLVKLKLPHIHVWYGPVTPLLCIHPL